MEEKKGSKSKTNQMQVVDNQRGIVPPQAREVEQNVLGICLLEKPALAKVLDILHADFFYVDTHQVIWEAIEHYGRKGMQPDMSIVYEYIVSKNQAEKLPGGVHYLVEITRPVASSANIEEWARIIIDKFMARSVIQITTELRNMLLTSEMDVYDVMELAGGTFNELQDRVFKSGSKHIRDLLVKRFEHYSSTPPKNGITGVPTGFSRMDKISHGWQPTDLIILAARPSMGKSALAGQLAFRPAFFYKVPTAIFSLEMASLRFIDRLVASETKTFLKILGTLDFKEGDLERIYAWMGQSGEAPIYFNDQLYYLHDIKAEIRKLVSRYGVKLIIIDYLGKIKLRKGDLGFHSNRDQEVGIITGDLKQLAKELDITIILLAQLNRAVESRSDNKPQLSDLRESGNIEQDADIVGFLYREMYYFERKNPGVQMDEQTRRAAELNILKNRNGELMPIPLIFKGEYAGYMDDDEFIDYDEITPKGMPSKPLASKPYGFVPPSKQRSLDMPPPLYGSDDAPF